MKRENKIPLEDAICQYKEGIGRNSESLKTIKPDGAFVQRDCMRMDKMSCLCKQVLEMFLSLAWGEENPTFDWTSPAVLNFSKGFKEGIKVCHHLLNMSFKLWLSYFCGSQSKMFGKCKGDFKL